MVFERRPSPARKTMSVPEMRKMLGLNKTESYWLIKKGYFRTEIIGENYRIWIDSFEEWYANQWHYSKVDGPKPGGAFPKYMPVSEMKSVLGIDDSKLNWLLHHAKRVPLTEIKGTLCVNRAAFEQWYSRQFRYCKINGEKPGYAYAPSYTPKDISKMLGLPVRNTVYCLLERNKIKTFKADGQLRIDKRSFHEWFDRQTHYKMKTCRDQEGRKKDGLDCKKEE